MEILDVKVHRCLSSRMPCRRELGPEGPRYVYWFALSHTVNGRTPLSKLIVKAVAPLRSLPLGMQLAAMNANRSRGHSAKQILLKSNWNYFLLCLFIIYLIYYLIIYVCTALWCICWLKFK